MVRFNTVYCPICGQRCRARGFRADDDGDTLILYDCDWCGERDQIAVYLLADTVGDVKSYKAEMGQDEEVDEFRGWMQEHGIDDDFPEEEE